MGCARVCCSNYWVLHSQHSQSPYPLVSGWSHSWPLAHHRCPPLPCVEEFALLCKQAHAVGLTQWVLALPETPREQSTDILEILKWACCSWEGCDKGRHSWWVDQLLSSVTLSLIPGSTEAHADWTAWPTAMDWSVVPTTRVTEWVEDHYVAVSCSSVDT